MIIMSPQSGFGSDSGGPWLRLALTPTRTAGGAVTPTVSLAGPGRPGGARGPGAGRGGLRASYFESASESVTSCQ